MKTKMRTEASTLVLNQHHKVSTLIRFVKSLILTGLKFTTVQINQLINSNDARKIINSLWCDGMDIQDVRSDNRCKLNWYVAVENQLLLFEERSV